MGELADLLFKTPGPVLAVAKIALSEDPWALPEKDGATIAHRFRGALELRRLGQAKRQTQRRATLPMCWVFADARPNLRAARQNPVHSE